MPIALLVSGMKALWGETYAKILCFFIVAGFAGTTTLSFALLTGAEHLAVSLPWAIGFILLCVLFILQVLHTKTEALWERTQHTMGMLVAWICMSFPLILLISHNRTSSPGVQDLFSGAWHRAWKATTHVMGFIMPFMIYPTIVYWLKYNTDKMFEKDRAVPGVSLVDKTETDSQTFHQANLITYTIKSLVIVLVIFSVLNSVGVQTDSILQITTVFSIGLSWSMRDWLSSMWGCFILAFSTKLCKKTYLRQTGDTNWLRVCRPGIIFVVCQRDNGDKSRDDDERIYVPNSSLMTRGFSTCSKVPERKPP